MLFRCPCGRPSANAPDDGSGRSMGVRDAVVPDTLERTAHAGPGIHSLANRYRVRAAPLRRLSVLRPFAQTRQGEGVEAAECVPREGQTAHRRTLACESGPRPGARRRRVTGNAETARLADSILSRMKRPDQNQVREGPLSNPLTPI